jgi:hypothetical protein
MSQQTRPSAPRPAAGPSRRRPSAAHGPSFDRLPRYGQSPSEKERPRRAASARDPEGRGALFSDAAQDPPPGSITLTCSSCRRTSVLTPLQLVTLSIPSLHLPWLRRHHPSWMRCPACRRRTWVALAIRF